MTETTTDIQGQINRFETSIHGTYGYNLTLFLKNDHGDLWSLIFAYFVDRAAARRTGLKLMKTGFQGSNVVVFRVTHRPV